MQSTFERREPEYVQAKRARKEHKAAAAAAAGTGAGVQPEEGEAAAAAAQAPAAAEAADACMPDAAPAEPGAATAGPAAEPAPEQPALVSYAAYYAERWGQRELDEGQPLLAAARVSRQQLARGLDMRRARKRGCALQLEAEGGWVGVGAGGKGMPLYSLSCMARRRRCMGPSVSHHRLTGSPPLPSSCRGGAPAAPAVHRAPGAGGAVAPAGHAARADVAAGGRPAGRPAAGADAACRPAPREVSLAAPAWLWD